jgi:glutaredoxin
MLKKIVLLSVITSTLLLSQEIDKNNTVYKSIQNVIPTTKIAKYEKAEIDGLYKVFTKRGDLLYIYPFKNLIFFGEIWNKQGYSFTRNDRTKFQKQLQEKQKENINKIINYDELTKYSLNVKNTKSNYEFVVFTDPLCPFCIKLEKYLQDKQVSIKINYTFPVKHKFAKDLALNIINVDKKYLHDLLKDTIKLASLIYENKKAITVNDLKNLQSKYKIEIKDFKSSNYRLKEMDKIAKQLNINGTPTILVVDNKTKQIVDMVIGADIKKISEYIK